MTALLSLHEVGYAYGPRMAVHACSLTVERGNCCGLLGPNGAGKTTLLKLMAGLLRPAAGAITYDGQPLSAFPAKVRAQRIAFVPQSTPDLFPLRVRDVVALGRVPYQSGLGWESAADRTAINTAMTQMQCTAWADRSLHTLSSGERQRVLIARALAQQPQLLLLDEPIAHLDPRFQFHVLDCLRAVQRETGLTVGFTLHDIHLARTFCDTLGLLQQGQLMAWGPSADVATPAHLTAAFATAIDWGTTLVATGTRR